MITAENARELQQRAVASRLARKIAPLEAQQIPQIVPQIPATIAQPIVNPETERVRERLEKLGVMMDKASDCKDLDALSRAYDRLFRAWMVLSGTPGSGQRKPDVQRKGRQLEPASEPIQLPNLPITGQSTPQG